MKDTTAPTVYFFIAGTMCITAKRSTPPPYTVNLTRFDFCTKAYGVTRTKPGFFAPYFFSYPNIVAEL